MSETYGRNGSYHSGMPKQKALAGYYAGFTDLVLPSDTGDMKFGKGVMLRPTFAHMMASDTIAFNPPVAPGKHHAGPWRATTQHAGFDIHTELFIPATYAAPHGLTAHDVARTIT